MTLSLEAYQAVGEFQGAIDHDAEEVLSAFPDDLASIQMLFQRITEKGEGEKPIRKPETLPVLAEITDRSPEDLDRIVRSFAERDLLVLREIHENGADLTEVDLPHECLCWKWGRLKNWIDEEAALAKSLAFLLESVDKRQWLAGAALGEAIQLRDQGRFDGLWARRYLSEADLKRLKDWVDESKKRYSAEQGRLIKERRRARWTAAIAAFVALSVAGLGWWATRNANLARNSDRVAHEAQSRAEFQAALEALAEEAKKHATALETDAERDRDKATRDELLAQLAAKKAQTETIRQGIYRAQTEFQISPVRGLLLTVEALDASKREQLKCGQQTCVEFATNALVDLLSQTGGIPIIGHTKPVLALSFSGNGKLLATADETTWKIWQVELPQTPFANGISQVGIQTMSLSGDGKLVATAAFGQAQLFWTDQSQRPPFQINQPDASLNNMGPSPTEAGFSANSKLLLASDGLANASVWRVDRLENPKVIAKIPDGFQVRFASFTSDEKFILTLDNDGKVWKWQLDQLISKVKPTPTLLGDLNGLVTAAFLGGDGHLLIPTQLNTEGLEKTARFIDLFDWKEASTEGRKDVAATQAAAIGPEGSLVAIADGGKVQIWRARSGPTRVVNRFSLNLETWVVLYGHEGPVRAVAFSPDGKYIATGGEDLTARIWQLDQPFAIDPKKKNAGWSARLDELVQLAARTAGRNFTCKEWAEFFPDETYRLTFSDLSAPEGGECSK